MKVVPLRFEGTDCPACGAKDSIRFIGRDNQSSNNMDGPLLGTYEAVCMNCDHRYIPRWNMHKYTLGDMAKKFNGFEENYTACDIRDVALTMAKQYELPSTEEEIEASKEDEE